MNVSIVIPAHNEEQTLPWVLRDLNAAIAGLPQHHFEVIVVDDHSTDATSAIAQNFGATVVTNPGAGGKGMALRLGFERASGDVIVMLDADYSHKPEDLHLFLDALQGDVGLVIGSRVFGGSDEYTHIRALGNVFLSAAVGLSLGRYLSDALNGYKAFRREVFTDFRYTSRAFEIEVELIANTLRRGYRVIECSSHERARAGGIAKSKVVRHGTRFLVRIIREGIKGVPPRRLAAAAAPPASADTSSAGGSGSSERSERGAP
ncbi:MAG TPA: glycosyltransferase family 2 protein [Vicinamibacterales bacterium]|nr:glycosyltransferase family 2 protein [Vicinamibacterales bacterium]